MKNITEHIDGILNEVLIDIGFLRARKFKIY